MIFAAGLGTRLRPLTNDRPKALVEVDGMPLLEIVIHRLKEIGCTDFIINVHHFADKVIDFLQQKYFLDNDIQITIADERELLLNTGGGLKNAKDFFTQDNTPFFVHNTDIVSNIDLAKMYAQHLAMDNIATLAVRERETSRYLLFDKASQKLCGWKNVKTEEYKWSYPIEGEEKAYAFSGIHVLSPRIFDFMPDEKVFSVIDTYLHIAKTENIGAYLHNEDIWLDAGKPAQILEAAAVLNQVL